MSHLNKRFQCSTFERIHTSLISNAASLRQVIYPAVAIVLIYGSTSRYTVPLMLNARLRSYNFLLQRLIGGTRAMEDQATVTLCPKMGPRPELIFIDDNVTEVCIYTY